MLRRFILGLVAATCVMHSAHAVKAADTGTLKMKFVYDGVPPQPQQVQVTKDIEFCGKTKLVDERLVVNPDNKGIQNIVVYVYTGRGGTKLPKMEPRNKTVTLANEACRFEPHIVILQAGDTLKVTNPDLVGHNANISMFNNKSVNLQIPPSGEVDVPLPEGEPAPNPVECNIHPWMRAYVLVQEHPFAAKSNENGELVIEGLPTGDVTFRIYAEAADGPIEEVKVDGKTTKWRRNRFEVDIEAGMNDMGVIEIPAAAFGG